MEKSKGVFRFIKWAIKSYLQKNSYVHESGFISSLEKGYPVDQQGDPVPWMNPNFTRFIARRVGGLTIFEYGSGYSTAFWARHCEQVRSIEHDSAFYEKSVRLTQKYSNAQVILSDKESYVEKVNQYDPDVVVIDGLKRRECIKKCSSKSEDIVLIVDDSSRKGLKKTIKKVTSESDYRKVEFYGPKAGHVNGFETSVLYKNNNVLEI
jgi:hypothetical protein